MDPEMDRQRKRERYQSEDGYRERAIDAATRYRRNNPEKVKATKAAYYQAHREEILADPRRMATARRHHLMKTYGITVEEYDAMLVEQDGRCAICRTDIPGGGRFTNFHVDHDGESKVIRGLLCQRCNQGIGMFDHDVNKLMAAAAYLMQYEDPVRDLASQPTQTNGGK